MKKIILALFSLFVICSPFSADANGVRLMPTSTTLKTVFEYYVPDFQTRFDAVALYNEYVHTNNGGIDATQLNAVCNTAGLDENTCKTFVHALGEQYSDVCQNNKNSPNCLELFKRVQTQMRQGAALAQVWAKTRNNETIVCEEKRRWAGNDDYMSCYSVADPQKHYEFQFDDLKESKDAATTDGLVEGICQIFGYEMGKHDYQKTYWCQKDSSRDGMNLQQGDCDKINVVAQEFGWTASLSLSGGNDPTMCYLKSRTIKEIINEYSGVIDNYVYSSGQDQTQLQAMPSLDESIYMYAQSRLSPTKITSFKCDKSHRVSSTALLSAKEDILTCYINDKRVDFVFDDLTQSTTLWGSRIIEGSTQAMGCRAHGGIFDGKNCADLTEDMCNQVAALNLKDCPDCKSAYWDTENKICMLPAAKTAKNIKTAISIAGNTGVALTLVVATVASGGSVLMITAASAAAVAAATSDGAKIVQDAVADDWVIEMNKINTPEQAKAFLSKHLTEIIGADHLSVQRRNGLDEMLNKVLNQAPDSYFAELVSDCIAENQVGEIYYDTSLPSCALNPQNGKNTLSTVIQVADTVQFIAGVVMIVAGLAQTAKTITYRTEQIADKIDELKSTGWIRRGSEWFNPATQETATTLPRGVPGWNPNPVFRGGGRWHGALYGNGNTGSFTKKADLIKWITENRVDRIVTTVWNPNLAVVAAGVANVAISNSKENLANVGIPPRGISAGDGTSDDQETLSADESDDTAITEYVEETILADESDDTTITEYVEETLLADESDDTATTEENVTGNYNYSAGVSGVHTSRNITPHATKKKPNTALIATAAVAGAIGTGWLIGSLVGKDGDKNVTASALSASNKDLEQLMQNAGGFIGVQNGSSLKLVPLPTTTDSYAPIVDISGNAVVVVDYRGYKLPYYMNSTAMRWDPLLGIGANGGWFNVFPTVPLSGIAIIDSIAGQLKQQLDPYVVKKYLGQGSANVRFPTAGPAAYQIINAEYPNGVVMVNTGTMTPSNRMLYNNNYQLIKDKLQ